MLHKVVISLASNYDQEQNLSEARHRLSQVLSSVSYTNELWTEPVKSVPSATSLNRLYLNQLAYAFTSWDCSRLEQEMKDMEIAMGRSQNDRKAGVVRIDLDLMQYDDERHHLRDWERPYIKVLLKQG